MTQQPKLALTLRATVQVFAKLDHLANSMRCTRGECIVRMIGYCWEHSLIAQLEEHATTRGVEA